MTPLARQLRRDSIRMVVHAGSGHVGGAMGVADILAELYTHTMRHDPKRPDWPDRDRLVLSNGHICAAWYAVLARTGYMPVEELASHRRFGSRLQGHPSRAKLGVLVESSSGPLGQGLSVANGIALANRVTGRDARVFCVLGDGEIAEGQVWEAAMTAAHYQLDTLTVIVLANGLQIDGATRDVKEVEPIDAKFASFGFATRVIDGHDPAAVRAALDEAHGGGLPHAIVARVVMASGYPDWEDEAKWHGSTPPSDAAEAALAHIGPAEGFDDFPIGGTR